MYSRAVGASHIAELKRKAQMKLTAVKQAGATLNEADKAKAVRAWELFTNGRFAAAITLLNEIKLQGANDE